MAQLHNLQRDLEMLLEPEEHIKGYKRAKEQPLSKYARTHGRTQDNSAPELAMTTFQPAKGPLRDPNYDRTDPMFAER